MCVPFTGDAVEAAEHAAVGDDAAADARAENDTEHDAGVSTGAVHGFGKGEAVGIVFDADFTLQLRLQILAQRVADQAGRIGVLDRAVAQGFGARNTEADAAALPEFVFDGFDERGDGADGRLIIALRCRSAATQQFPTGGIERDDLDFCATEVDAQAE